jgi:2-aminoethylphosphonate-pyruvate transaminase
LFALDAALDELLKQGVARRIAHYERLNRWLRSELRRLGLKPMTETGCESHTITTWQVPSYLRFEELYRSLKRRGYIIYSCKAQLRDRCFQIANMGELTDEMVAGFIEAMDLVLRQAASRSRPELRVAI